MAPQSPKRTALSATEPTIDASPAQASIGGGSGAASSNAFRRRFVALVSSSSPELTRETEVLLCQRLRLAAIILFAGFLAFIPVHVFRTEFSDPNRRVLFAFHLFTAAVLGICSALLCKRCAVSLKWLRASELVIFALPALFLVSVQQLTILRTIEEGFVLFPVGVWLVLIYTYALFIPNSIGRAAVVIGLMTAAPLSLFLLLALLHPDVARLVTADQLLGQPLILILAAVGSILGVDTIGSLRRDAFEARQLGQYRLTRRLGSGGMGEVYLAEHQLLKRPCVVKIIRPDRSGDARMLARFQREVHATAKLSHWNTIEIFDYGSTADGTFYYVMEYLPGMSLAELVERFGPMPPDRVIHLLRQAADALAEAHATGLIHRDVKPGNIFSARRGGVYDVVKLLDFGLVKPLVDDEPVELTTEGSITGSPLFMSPEQAVGDATPDARSDIYSLGAVGYYLLTGQPPFVGDNPIKVMIAQAHDDVVPPSQHHPGVPADLEEVILRCLAKRPADRFQNAAALADALGACRDAGLWTRQRASQWWQ